MSFPNLQVAMIVTGSNIHHIPLGRGRIAVLADLHFDHYARQGKEPLAYHALEDRLPWSDLDGLILAGDLADKPMWMWKRAFEYLARFVAPERIFVVPGNHDYYYHALDAEADLQRLAEASGAHFVQKAELRHGTERYLCATLWTDFNLLGAPTDEMKVAGGRMRDYELISKREGRETDLDQDALLMRGRYVEITPEDTRDLHLDHRGWLEAQLSSQHFAGHGRTIVVTHHGPHPATAGALDRLASAFHSDLSELLGRHRIDYWYFGHSHRRFSATVGGTRIRNVSLGYLHERHSEEEDDLAEACMVPAPATDR